MPRTKGITLSHGEYVYFLDADDILIDTALERMYLLAKESNADVVYCEKYYTSDDDGSNIQPSVKKSFVKKPTFDPEDLKERFDRLIQGGWYLVFPWLKLVRRDLMIEHEIFFPNVHISEDDIWTYTLIFSAKKFLRVPEALCIHREAEDSMMRKKRTPQEFINFRLNPLIKAIKILDKILERHEFFKANPSCRYNVLKKFVYAEINPTLNAAQEIADWEIYSAVKDTFGEKFGEYDILIPALCTELYKEKAAHGKDSELLHRLKSFITARFDIKLQSPNGNFEILSVSDDNAKVMKPQWLQQNGSGYMINSYVGLLELVAKASVDGKISLNLRSSDIRDPDDKSKKIPH